MITAACSSSEEEAAKPIPYNVATCFNEQTVYYYYYAELATVKYFTNALPLF